jgi:diadenosine tetraphosphate (Ap4A) HIT family hydrolase
MATIFTKIIDGALPAHFVWNDDRVVAFLSINPLNPGHTLVVPRREVDHWLDLDPPLRHHLIDVAHAVGKAIEAAFSPKKVGLMLAGLEVPHVHVHVVPIWNVHDLDFSRAERNPPPGSLEGAAEKLRQALRDQGHSI